MGLRLLMMHPWKTRSLRRVLPSHEQEVDVGLPDWKLGGERVGVELLLQDP
jgi:hypothetical protein